MILLDTHAWLWWLGGDPQLSQVARDAIEAAATTAQVAVSSISMWEVSMLARRGRLRLASPPRNWIAAATALDHTTVIPVDAEIALLATELPEHHRDPADRFLVATALHHGLHLVTRDHALALYEGVTVVW